MGAGAGLYPYFTEEETGAQGGQVPSAGETSIWTEGLGEQP